MILLKGIIDKFFKPIQNTKQEQVPPFSQADVEALIDAKLKEHSAALDNNVTNMDVEKQTENQDDYKLTAKQTEYALSLIEKVNNEFELAIEPTKLTVKDLNRLIAYQRYKNKGTLINLVKKGVLRKK
ncbi:ABC transporter ATP-binding protein [Neobacillus niacini]|uniref:ABC transporter ATP-binding protein n=1 Tax=Neobacillus niacini TaxID=86668 RepID=UPI0021CB1C1C|nr:ABC transporter ATP-binding protein [Neobacillus niacini]MCM3764488.1 ABC transporter ATP-binding protein [Neobacillus niacini]